MKKYKKKNSNGELEETEVNVLKVKFSKWLDGENIRRRHIEAKNPALARFFMAIENYGKTKPIL